MVNSYVVNSMAGGRQREFDKAQALDSAMQVFWQKGFIGASLADLTLAMGINKPSMYAAFGNKEKLFVQAVQHYLDDRAGPQFDLLNEEGVALPMRVRNYVCSVLSGQCAEERPLGCFVSQCVAEAVNENMPAEALEFIEKVKSIGETSLIQLFTGEQEKGQLPQEFDPKLGAALVITFLHGTAAMARSGKPYDELEQLINPFLVSVFGSAQGLSR